MLDPFSHKLLFSSGNHGPIVLMYHSVVQGNTSSKWRWAVSCDNFERHLDILQGSGWKTLLIRDLVNIKEPVPPRSVVITFDDGYENNYIAFDKLVARKMIATWFIVTRDIGKESGWRDVGSPVLPLLNIKQLQEMHAAGMEIASHTYSHSRLTELGMKETMRELTGSKYSLEDILGADVTSFAYPYGLYNDHVEDAVRNAGYQAACITQSGWALKDDDPLRIRRVSIFAHDTLGTFARKLAFADNDTSWSMMRRYAFRQMSNRCKEIFTKND